MFRRRPFEQAFSKPVPTALLRRISVFVGTLAYTSPLRVGVPDLSGRSHPEKCARLM